MPICKSSVAFRHAQVGLTAGGVLKRETPDPSPFWRTGMVGSPVRPQKVITPWWRM